MLAIDDQQARALLARCSKGDESGLVDLHKLLAGRIHGFAMHRLNSEDDARAVVIDTLHEIWRCAAKFKGESAVSTWAFGIARHKILDTLRNRQVDCEDIDDVTEELADECTCVEHRQQRSEESRLLHGCLTVLKAMHRECLQLVYFEGMSICDVSVIQKSPENTIKTRLFHARNQLRDCLARQGLVGLGG